LDASGSMLLVDFRYVMRFPTRLSTEGPQNLDDFTCNNV
jgi:hypothetical protein